MNTVKPESIALFCLTPGGVALAKRLARDAAVNLLYQ
ncbi:cobalamin biosynthesis protein CbiG [Salmonella enterica subsp. enterica serovar Typhimurium]|nr:cobalamin biosynthesis protein CbiG [Salmonella enterica subsp. enterica serovar Typhimurium]